MEKVEGGVDCRGCHSSIVYYPMKEDRLTFRCPGGSAASAGWTTTPLDHVNHSGMRDIGKLGNEHRVVPEFPAPKLSQSESGHVK